MNYRRLKAFSRLYSAWARYDHAQGKLYDDSDNEISTVAQDIVDEEDDIEAEENITPDVEVILNGNADTGMSVTPDGKIKIMVGGTVVATLTDAGITFNSNVTASEFQVD
jgi:hypothetical protein